ncbi:hypothetical protein NDI52_32300 [Leptolyngbya sp. PL-A3]|uniref:hypothetical protein n=1 Tax=Leptolyngbya sp. PL-A3 TaxID=2933911 RepID=UPI003299426F
MTLISGWIRFNKPSSLCPVCGDHRNECRQSGQTEKIFCRGKADNPRFKFLGEDKNGFGIFTDRAIADPQTEADRAEWLRQRQAERALQQEAERRRAAVSMPVSNRHHHFSKLLRALPPLTPADIEDLTSRGFSLADIERIGFRSVVKGQRLPEQFPSNLPGVARDGRSLLIGADGYIYPVPNATAKFGPCSYGYAGQRRASIAGYPLRVTIAYLTERYPSPTSSQNPSPEIGRGSLKALAPNLSLHPNVWVARSLVRLVVSLRAVTPK